MARLIDADDLKATFVVSGEFAKDLWHAGAIRLAISNAPTVDAVPVVHGRWVWTETGEEDYEQYWVCSKCGEYTYFVTNYCAGCGARMDLKEESDA